MRGIDPAAAREWRDRGQLHEIVGHDIFVVEGGDRAAPPLLLLHGFPTSSLDWLPIWEGLCARYRVIAFDFLGFGYSAKPRHHRYDLLEQADIAVAVAARTGTGPVHLLAHDYGVSVAQELLARGLAGSGPAILSCLFLNGGVLPAEHRPRPIQKLLAGPFGWLFAHLTTKAKFRSGFSAVFAPDTQPTDDEIDGFWAAISHHGGHRIQHRLIAYMADRRVHAARWRAVLEQPPAPIAFVNGTLDPVSGGHLADALAAMGLEVTRFDDIGHYPQTEAPGRTLAAYLRFRERFDP
jgi:pimeloyl-ACP methyl ester carboxylesterase